jgi:hypothetical protein
MDISWQVVTIVIVAIIALVVVVALFRDSINAYITARSVRPIVEYQTTAEEHLVFNRQIKDPIYHNFGDSNLWPMLAQCNIIGGGLRSDDKLTTAILTFLENFKSGSAEDSLHGRDDCLLRIIMLSSGIPMEIKRNKVSPYTSENTRVDCLLHPVGQPVLVAVEEKDADYKVREADADLLKKVKVTQAHGQLPFIVCIAIAGDTVEFSKMYRDSNSLNDRTSYQLYFVRNRVDCVVAAVNIGRWIKWVVASNSMLPVSHHYGISYETDRRILCIALDTVTKTYKTLSQSEKSTLKKFYVDCKDAKFVEKATVKRRSGDNNLTLELTPVGVAACRPMFTCVADVVLCVACIVTAIESVHLKNWCLLDLRWPNIIRVLRNFTSGPVRWFIIDCEFATRVGENLPLTIRHLIPQERGPKSSKCLDWYMLAQMLRDTDMLGYENMMSVRDMRQYLESMTDNSPSPRQHEFFNQFDFGEL